MNKERGALRCGGKINHDGAIETMEGVAVCKEPARLRQAPNLPYRLEWSDIGRSLASRFRLCTECVWRGGFFD